MRASRALFSLLAPLVLIAATSSEADAYERQWQAGFSAGYAQLVNQGATAAPLGSYPGIGATFSLTYGLSDAWNIIGHVDGSIHPGATPVAMYGGGAGVSYVIDVVRWVPWLGVTAGGYGVTALDPCVATTDAPCTNGRLGLSLLGGLDYQLSRSFSIGGGGRYTVLLFGNQNKVDHTFSILARFQYIWGY
jgi:opacity protein-like surface antigen